MFACLHSQAEAARILQQCASSFAPEAELTAVDTIVFDVSRLNRMYGGPGHIAEAIARHAASLGLEVNIALAPNPETALMAARNFPGVTVIPEQAASALAQLEIGNLPLTPQLWETLESWGIRTFHDLAKLPADGLAERLGTEGVYLHRLARGAVDRPLRVFRPQQIFEDRADLEHPLTELEPLLFILARILNEQCEKLQAHGLAALEMRVTLELDKEAEHIRTLRLPLPMRQSKALLKLLQLDLEAHRPTAPVRSVHLALKPASPRTVQNGMFLPVTPAADTLELTLARIRALVGERNAGVPELLDTHRPAPFRLALRQPSVQHRAGLQTRSKAEVLPLAFRYFQPPLSARIELENGRPLRLSAGSIRGNVITYAGPWRSSGDWWTDNPWSREEWDVSLNDGAIYRIYREPDASWFIEGAYD